MTMHANAKFTVERAVNEYNYENRRNGSNEFSYWDIIRMIKNAYDINAITKSEAERYCYQMHCTFEEMKEA